MILSNLIDGLDVTVNPKDTSTSEIKGLSCDSRDVSDGFIFAAFKGDAVDGITFVDKALSLGAVAVLCDESSVLTSEQEAQCIVLRAKEPRKIFAEMVGRFYHKQPEHMVAVTGTNGKTSVAHFCRQIWHYVGKKSASIGTIGAQDCADKRYDVAGLTTPDAVGLHKVLSTMSENGVEYAAMEASSHGLSQYRQDGVMLEAAGFTSFSRDHLDYHKDEQSYFNAKSRLFSELLPEGAVAVLNADIKEFTALADIARKRKQTIITYGEKGEDYKLLETKPANGKQFVKLRVGGKQYSIELALVGKFQVYNMLCALGLVVASGIDVEVAISVLEKLYAVNGRMEMVSDVDAKYVYVDYAHTPDGLEKALEELKPYAKGNLVVLFGCGGDRDAGKRPEMGAIASRIADKVIVTDDNPRTEDAASIRAVILKGCDANAVEIANRKEAIFTAVNALQEGDILLIAGKGHEDYQIIGKEKFPFDEKQLVKDAIAGEKR